MERYESDRGMVQAFSPYCFNDHSDSESVQRLPTITVVFLIFAIFFALNFAIIVLVGLSYWKVNDVKEYLHSLKLDWMVRLFWSTSVLVGILNVGFAAFDMYITIANLIKLKSSYYYNPFEFQIFMMFVFKCFIGLMMFYFEGIVAVEYSKHLISCRRLITIIQIGQYLLFIHRCVSGAFVSMFFFINSPAQTLVVLSLIVGVFLCTVFLFYFLSLLLCHPRRSRMVKGDSCCLLTLHGYSFVVLICDFGHFIFTFVFGILRIRYELQHSRRLHTSPLPTSADYNTWSIHF